MAWLLVTLSVFQSLFLFETFVIPTHKHSAFQLPCDLIFIVKSKGVLKVTRCHIGLHFRSGFISETVFLTLETDVLWLQEMLCSNRQLSGSDISLIVATLEMTLGVLELKVIRRLQTFSNGCFVQLQDYYWQARRAVFLHLQSFLYAFMWIVDRLKSRV